MDGRWQRGGRWLVLAALWHAGLARGDDPAAASSAGAPVRVMSFNIRYGTAADGADAWPLRRGFLADTIAAFDPDILGTQETLADQLDFLKERFPALAAHGVGRDDGARRGEMAAILFRRERFDVLDSGHYWLSPTPEVVGSRGWDAALPRIVSWLRLADRCAPGSRPILVVNTHFDHRGSVARLESAKLLRTRVEADVAGARVVITGDFNAAAGSPPHASLFGPPTGGGTVLVDTFQSLHPTPDGPAGTFNGFDPTRTGGERIDWIGCSADWHVREAEIDRTTRDGRVPSDHFPVTAVLGPK